MSKRRVKLCEKLRYTVQATALVSFATTNVKFLTLASTLVTIDTWLQPIKWQSLVLDANHWPITVQQSELCWESEIYEWVNHQAYIWLWFWQILWSSYFKETGCGFNLSVSSGANVIGSTYQLLCVWFQLKGMMWLTRDKYYNQYLKRVSWSIHLKYLWVIFRLNLWCKSLCLGLVVMFIMGSYFQVTICTSMIFTHSSSDGEDRNMDIATVYATHFFAGIALAICMKTGERLH